METTRPYPKVEPPTLGTLAAEPGLAARYELLGAVAHGGMGAVFRARHKGLEMPVAIKVMLAGAPPERFLREARLLARITSPFVVGVRDFEILSNGCPLLVMEWVEGNTLGQLVKAQAGPLPEEQVLSWMRHTCEGMLAAAEQGIIHRDLKPSNLLIDAQGRARVADFGLALGPAVAGDLTQSGLLMGTPYYMAPEQAEDPHGVDTRADVYSFGATFFHALTGRLPFEGGTPFTVLYKHKTEPLISPRVFNPGLSERTCAVLERCLAKSPADRFSSFAEVLKHLRPGGDTPSPWGAADDPELNTYLARYGARRTAYLTDRTRRSEELDAYVFPHGQALRILRGDIVEQKVDAIVSSDTALLGMTGGVSLAIHRAGGETIAAQAEVLAPVRPGRAVVTSAGRLPARFVFHGITAGKVGTEFVRPSRDLITEILASCFYHADSHHVTSLAIPQLGTGAQGFPRDVCLDTMFHYLARTFLRGLTCVREARIVLFD
jgi:O-acetyl-ADP-ribose deacetylase (regulator of RNase III)